MAIFDPIKLKWEGIDYFIPSDRVVRAIARVESEAVTIEELARFYGQRKTVPPATIALAYGTLLRFAGAEVADDAVYNGLFVNGGGENAQMASNILIGLMTPTGVEVSSSKPNPTKRPRKAARSGS